MAQRSRFRFRLGDAQILDGRGNRFVPQQPRDQRDVLARPIHMRRFAAPDRMAGKLGPFVSHPSCPGLDQVGVVATRDRPGIRAL